MIGDSKVKGMQPLMGSEDFAFYQESLPGYFFMLGMQDTSIERLESAHSPYFKINEDVLPYGAALHASLATTYLLRFQQNSPVAEENHRDEL